MADYESYRKRLEGILQAVPKLGLTSPQQAQVYYLLGKAAYASDAASVFIRTRKNDDSKSEVFFGYFICQLEEFLRRAKSLDPSEGYKNLLPQ